MRNTRTSKKSTVKNTKTTRRNQNEEYGREHVSDSSTQRQTRRSDSKAKNCSTRKSTRG
ncbi:MAG: hypothetical protein PT941_00045 [Bacillales bacterium]|nr:hypothetical protein [Bacillales bacterium]